MAEKEDGLLLRRRADPDDGDGLGSLDLKEDGFKFEQAAVIGLTFPF